jgi:hypothetical protein
MAAAKVEIIYEAEATSLKATVNEVNKANSEVVKDAQVSAQKVSDSFKEAGNNIANAFANQKIKAGLDNLNKELKQTSAVVVKSAQDVSKFEDRLRELSVAGQRNTDEFKDIAKAVGEYKSAIIAADRAVDLYAKSTDAATGRIGELEDKLYDLALAGKSNTKEFKDLVKEVATVRRAVIETDAQVDALSQRGARFKGFVQNVELVGSAFQALEGAQALIGQENEDLQKTLVRLQAITAITSGIEQARVLILEQLAAKTGVAGAVQSAYNVIVGTSTGLLKGLRIALAATGIGLFVFGLVALVENFDKVKKALENSIPGFKQVSNAIGGVVDTIKEWIGASEEADRAASAFDAAAKKQRAASDATVERIERQIDIEKSAGRSTVALEIQREQAVINANRAIIADYVKKAGTLSQLSDEEKAKAKEVNDEAVKAVFDASARIIVIRNEAEREATQKALEQAKERAQLELEIKKASNESIAKLDEQNTEFSNSIRLQLEKEYQEELKKLAEEKKKRDEEIARSFENINEELLDGQINRVKRLEAEEGSTSERRIQLIELESKKQIDAIRLTVDDKLKADNQILLIEAETQQAIRDERKKSRDEAIDDALQVANAVAGTLSKIIELQSIQSQNRIDQITATSDAEKLAIEQSTASEVNKQRQLDALQLRTNQKIAAEKTKQAEAAKALALFNAIIGTAQSVASAGNPVLAAIQLAAGLAQIAIIRAQPIPKFKKGGPVGGKSHEAGGTLIEAEKGEYVVNKSSVSQHRKALDAMNTSSAAFKKFIDEKYVRPAIAGYAMNNKRDGITVNASLNSKSMERKLDKLNKTMAGKQIIVNINGSDSRYSWQQN